MPYNQYGQLVNDKGEIVYEYGPNKGQTAAQAAAANQQTGGAGSSTVTNAKTGDTQITTTPNLLGQQATIAADQAKLQSQLAAQAAAQKAALDQQAFQSRLDAFRSLSGSGGPGGAVQHPGASGAEGMANALAFGQAKDTAGQAALGALKSLQNQMAERGMTGSSEEALGTAGILGGGAAQIANYNKDQLLAQIARQQAIDDATYQGNITMRGQDLSAKNALLGLISSGVAY